MISLFVSYSINNININKWIESFLKDIEKDFFYEIINELNTNNKKNFLKSFEYDLERFKKTIINYDKIKIQILNPHEKSLFYHKHLSFNKKNVYPGCLGHDSVLIPYDNLIQCKNNFEWYLIYNCLHVGDWDTTGTIAGFLYGLLYENEKILLLKQNFEFKQLLKMLSKKIFEFI